MLKKLTFLCTAMALLLQIAGCAQKTQDKMEWWRSARFGMFIHWGIYSVPAGVYQGKEIPGIGEWIMNNAKIPVAEYEKYAAKLNPVDFDGDEGVKMA